VVEAGRTTVAEVLASARMIEEAGGSVAGAVLVYRAGEEGP
jgi:hypothetical protein